MKSLFLGSAMEKSGKTMVALGMALNHPGKVGYYKPFMGNLIAYHDKIADQDASLMKEALNLKDSEEALAPFTYNIFDPVPMSAIVAAYERVRNSYDAMLVEGTRDIVAGSLHKVSGIRIAEAISADVILVSTAQPIALDKIAMLRRWMENFKVNFRGVILNRNDNPQIQALLEEKGIKVFGSIPEVLELRQFRVREVAIALNAEVVSEEGMENRVEDIMVGAMYEEAAMKVMRRVPRKALITGGDRADLQLAALTTDTSCLVLTGGMYPSKTVIARAYERRVPILVTSRDTLETAELIDHLIVQIDPNDSAKIAKVKQVVKEHVDLEAIWG
jgi:BioD-like phosphotransacetylase family protein